MGAFETANILAIKAAAAQPEWVEVAGVTALGIPSSESDGYDLNGSLYCHVIVSARENPAYRTARIVLATFDNVGTTSVTLTIDGVVGTDATGPWAGIAALAAAIVTLVNGMAVDVDAVISGTDTIVLTGSTEANFALSNLTFNGTTTSTVTGDAATADFDVWALDQQNSTVPVPWSRIVAMNESSAVLATTTASTPDPSKKVVYPVPGGARIAVRCRATTAVATDIATESGFAWIGPSYAITSTGG